MIDQIFTCLAIPTVQLLGLVVLGWLCRVDRKGATDEVPTGDRRSRQRQAGLPGGKQGDR